jgi:hypothetical protein
MMTWRTRRGCTFCATAVFLIFFLLTFTLYLYPNSIDANSIPIAIPHIYSDTDPSEWPKPTGFPTPPVGYDRSAYSVNGWTFDAIRDGHNFALTDEQCSAAFPNFYYEIDRAVQYRKDKNLGNITLEHVDITWRADEIMRAMIYDNQLYILDAKWAVHGKDVPRALAIIHSIQRAVVSSPVPLPNIEFSFCLSDWPGDAEHKYPLWVLTRFTTDDYEKWVMPDFGYWSWPGPFMGEYSRLRSEIMDNEQDWDRKKAQAVWRGATVTNELRDKLVKVAKGKKWADVETIVWEKPSTLEQGLTVPEHCDYQYLLHTEGKSHSNVKISHH